MHEARHYSYVDCDDLDACAPPAAAIPIHLTGRLIRFGNEEVLLFTIRDIAAHRSLIHNLLATQNALIKNQRKLEVRIRELSAVNEVTAKILNTIDLEEILSIVLMAVTSGFGWGFNRGLICLYDPAANTLTGTAGLGPSNSREAEQLWSFRDGGAMTLAETLAACRQSALFKTCRVRELVQSLRFNVLAGASAVHRAAREQCTILVQQDGEVSADDRELCELLGVKSFLVVPLVSMNQLYGVLITDNNVTRATISPEAMEQAEVFARHASVAIENAQLYERLQRSVRDLQEANRQLKDNRDRLVNAERLSAVGRVTAQVAHEIRNPLTAIGGFARNLARKLPHNEPLAGYAKIIVEEVDRLESLLTQLLGYTRRPQQQWTSVSLNRLAGQVADMLHDELRLARVTVTLDLDPQLPLLSLQQEHIEQVLINLIRNAKQAMADTGGTLLISSRCEHAAVCLEVADNGPGIPEHVMPNLFSGFFTTKPDGAGLGLSICKQIMQEHGGDIRVTSSADTGAVFTLAFPLPTAHEAPPVSS